MKRFLTFLLCTSMLLCMMVSVSAAEGDDNVVYLQSFNSAEEVQADDISWSNLYSETNQQGAISVSYENGGIGDGTNSLKLTAVNAPTLDPNGRTTMFQKTITLKEGNKYQISWSAKGEAAVEGDIPGFRIFYVGNANNKYKTSASSGWSQYYPSMEYANLNSAWTDYSATFLVYEFAGEADTYQATIRGELKNTNKGDVTWIDNLQVKEWEAPVVTVNITGDGTVKFKDKPVTSGSLRTVYDAATVFNFECDDLVYPRVKLNGKRICTINKSINFGLLKDGDVIDVSFESPAVIFENHYDTEEDIDVAISQATGRATYSFEPNGGNDGGALKFTFKEGQTTSTKGRLANIGSAEFKEGYAYNVSFKTCGSVKSTGAKFLVGGGALISNDAGRTSYPINKSNQTFDTKWTTHSYTFTIDDYITSTDAGAEIASATYDSKTCNIMFEPSGYAAGDWLMMDDIVITRIKAPVVTVKKNDGGSVERFYSSGTFKDTEEYWENVRSSADGDTYCALEGATVKFRVIPDEGKKATVKVGDSVIVPDSSNIVSFKLNEDTEFSVTFADSTVNAGIEDSKTTSWFREVDGVPTIYVYSQLTAFTTGESFNYGIKLWDKANPEAVAVLHARDDEDTLSVAAPGKIFAIKAYGDAIKSANSYEAVPFIGETEGTAQTPAFGE